MFLRVPIRRFEPVDLPAERDLFEHGRSVRERGRREDEGNAESHTDRQDPCPLPPLHAADGTPRPASDEGRLPPVLARSARGPHNFAPCPPRLTGASASSSSSCRRSRPTACPPART